MAASSDKTYAPKIGLQTGRISPPMKPEKRFKYCEDKCGTLYRLYDDGRREYREGVLVPIEYVVPTNEQKRKD